MSDIIIRKAVEEDVSAIAKIEKASIPQPWSEAAFADALTQENAVTLVAEADGEIAGFITGVFLFDNADIYSVATAEQHRKKGVGAMLLKSFFYTLPTEVEVVWLEVRESNSAAISLYEKSGFERVGLRKNFYEQPRENAVLYNKQLSK
ncbi:MAG: ribosomal protein S18-alanine N-acetyltransferase [Oscillospiraceae bacterium]|nr:ribosomal protein S18-alanine N-acetyltransferase [Oscillospiraceae bacterium]